MPFIARDVIEHIRFDFVHAEQNKQESIAVSRLMAYLDDVQRHFDKLAEEEEEQRSLDRFDRQLAQERSLSEYRVKHERFMAKYRVKVETELEMFRSVITAGQSAIKASLLVNAGAAIALLAFVGSLLRGENELSLVSDFAYSLLLFSAGVLVAAIAGGIAYLTQITYQWKWRWCGGILNFAAGVLVSCSFGIFGWAIWNTYKVLQL